MPLPSGGTSWPPEEIAPVLDLMRLHRAWWTGDPGSLVAAYSKPSLTNRTAQYRGGVVGTIARAWWGKPIPQGEQTAKSHVPVGADIAAMSADLLFAEPPKLSFEDSDDATRARVDEYAEDGLWASMREAADSQAALGGVYLRVVWDKGVNPDRPWLAPVDADCAVPEFAWDRLKAVTFWHVIERKGDIVTRLLERHEVGSIQYGLYEGTEDNLGTTVPLTDHADTAGVAELLSEGDRVNTGVDFLTAVYVPNMRPNKMWRLPVGRSDFSGIETLMDELDEIVSLWLRDVTLAKARLMVPEVLVTNLGKGQGARFDEDQRLLMGMPGMDPNSTKPELFQPLIRWEEHKESAQYRIEQIVRGAGYSMSTFSPSADSGTAVTASEIQQREKRSLTTRGRKIGYWTPALAQAIEVLLAIDQVHFGAQVTVQRPSVEFPDAVSPDPEAVAQTLQLLDQASAMSVEAKIEYLHPDWDEEQVAEEVARLTGSELEKAVAAVKGLASVATELGKASVTGGVDEATLQVLWQFMMSKVVDEDGEPVDPGTPDFAGAAERADQAAREASAERAAAGVASGVARPGTPGGARPGSGRGTRPFGR